MNNLIDAAEMQHQGWLDGILFRQSIPSSERPVFAIAVIYTAGALAAGFIETESHLLANAKRIYESLIAKAEGGGFRDADLLDKYFSNNRWTSLTEDIAADLVECLGGADTFIDLFDLLTRSPASMGAVQ